MVYGFGENKNTVLPGVSNKATDNASIALTYANGPITAGVAYQEEKTAAASVTVPGTVAQNKLKYSLIGGSYDFGMAKLVGSYNTAKNNTTKDKEGQIGVVVPFGAAAVSAGYARSKSEAAGVSNTGKGFSLLATYDMSKRTRLYAGAQSVKAHVGNAAAESKATDYGLGLRHSF